MGEFQHYIILSLIFLVTTILVRAMLSKSRSKARLLPPSPRALPIIGHLHLLSGVAHQALHKLSNRHGPLIHLSLGSVYCIVVSSPEMAKEFLRMQETSFLNRPRTIASEHISYDSSGFAFAQHGPYWKFMKKLCVSRLLGAQTLDQLLPVRRDEVKRFLSLMAKRAEKKEAVDVEGELLRLTNNVISRMTMNRRCSEDDAKAEEIRKLVVATAELTGELNLSDHIWLFKRLDLQGFGKRLREFREKFDAIMERIMKEHEVARNEGNEAKDLLHILTDISEDETSEIRLSRDNIKAFILDMFAAGTDTSAITIEWALSELINHPNIMNKARVEIDSVIGKTRLVEESDIPNLPYLQAIVKETLRLHPTGPIIVRESTESCIINGYEIPEKTQLFVNVWAIGRDPKHWEDPLEFKPERFLVEQGSGNTSQLDVRGQNYHFLPFGSGRRACPGITLAMHVVQTSLAAMIQCFEWTVDGTVDMEEGNGMTLLKARPLICVPVARLSPLPI